MNAIQQLAALIDELAMIPAPDYYKPGDVTAEKVAEAWREKNRILAAYGITAKVVDLEFMGGTAAGRVPVTAFESSGNALPTSRVLDGSRDHGAAEEWAEPGTVEYRGQRVRARRIYLFDAADIADREPEAYPWDDEHTARIVVTE